MLRKALQYKNFQQARNFATKINVRPATPIKLMDLEKNTVTTDDLFPKDKKVVVFSVPGAFTPVCSSKHVPNFISNAEKLKQKGIDKIICLSINDPFVMKAWAEKLGNPTGIQFVCDWNGEFTKSVGLDIDLGAAGLGTRSKRFSALVVNGEVKEINVEKSPSEFDVSAAEKILEKL